MASHVNPLGKMIEKRYSRLDTWHNCMERILHGFNSQLKPVLKSVLRHKPRQSIKDASVMQENEIIKLIFGIGVFFLS